MTTPAEKNAAAGRLRAVVLDWAGTAVDFGCRGPAAVFVAVFERFGVAVTPAEARRFMGLAKKDHIRAMAALPRIAEAWRAVHGRPPGEPDVEALYAATEPMMVAAVARHAAPIPGLLEFVAALRRQGVKIGTSTGYTRPMMAALVPEAAAAGYRPDAVVCSSDVPAGRPHPYMCYLNALKLEAYPMWEMIKIGDTPSDIAEGLNAGMWTVGVTRSGNLVGLAAEELERLSPAERGRLIGAAERTLREAGAHDVVEGLWEALPAVAAIAERIAAGERP
jgi:phosphonoacetaldehyde hydrolase